MFNLLSFEKVAVMHEAGIWVGACDFVTVCESSSICSSRSSSSKNSRIRL